jgi:hypothetical protein
MARIILKKACFAHVVGVARSYTLWTFPVRATRCIGRSWAVSLAGFLLKLLNYPSTSVVYEFIGVDAPRIPGASRTVYDGRGSWQMCKF